MRALIFLRTGIRIPLAHPPSKLGWLRRNEFGFASFSVTRWVVGVDPPRGRCSVATRRAYAASVLLTAPPPVHAHAHTAGGAAAIFSEPVYLAVIAALVLWVTVYLVYKLAMTKRRDYGLPVRRRLMCRKLRVHEDQTADAPFWWTDLQVQRAVRSYWRRTLRSAFAQGSDPATVT